VLLEHIGEMAGHIGGMSAVMKTSQTNMITREDVTTIVKHEVQESIKPTNELLLKMTAMLENMNTPRND